MVPPSRPPLKLIANQKSRKLTFRRRSIGLKKKSSEMSTLCGIDVAIIMYEDHQAEPVFWPPDVEKVKSILARYKTHREEERAVKRSNLSGFFQERTWNMLGNLNVDVAYPIWDDRLNNFSVDELREFLCRLEFLEGKIELEMMRRILFEDKWASSITNDKDESIGASGSNTLPHASDPLMHSENIMFNGPPGPSATCYYLATIPLQHSVYNDWQHSLYHDQQHSLYHGQQHSLYPNQLENPGPSAAFYCPPNSQVPLQHVLYEQLENVQPSATFHCLHTSQVYTSPLQHLLYHDQLENTEPSATFHCLPTTQVYSSPLLHPLDYGLENVPVFNNPGTSAAYANADMSDDALVDWLA